MVTKTDTTELVTEPNLQQRTVPSFKRWLKHFVYKPASKRYFSKVDQTAIAEAVEAEKFYEVTNPYLKEIDL